jgi:mannosyltransferase
VHNESCSPTSAPAATARSLVRRRGGLADEVAVVGCLSLVAAVLRFADIGTAGYWRDEIFTVDLVRLPFSGMLHAIPRTEGTPPLYYVVAWLWARAFGSHEAALRSLSATIGVIAVVPVYVAARSLFGRRAATVASLLAATSPLFVWYGQEARAYELGVLAVLVSFAALAHISRTGPSRRAVAVWTLAACAALATHYFTAFVVAPELACLLLLLRRAGARSAAAAATVAVGATATALVPLALDQRGNPAWIAGQSLGRRVLDVPSEFLAGPQPSAALLSVPLLGLLLYGVASLRRADRRTAAVVLTIGSIGVLAPLTLAVAGIDFFLARNVMFAFPFFIVAVAAGLSATRTSRAATVALVALNLAVVAATAGQPKYGREDWRAVASALGPARVPRAYVISPLEGVKAFEYYRPAAVTLAQPTARVEEIDVIGLPVLEHAIGRNPATPRPAHPPRLRGFRLVATTRAQYYVLYRLRTQSPVAVKRRALARLGLEASFELLTERPAAP